MILAASKFFDRFPNSHFLGCYLGQWLTDEENIIYHENATGEVGEAREHRGSTRVVYSILNLIDADQAKSYYRAKMDCEERDTIVLTEIRKQIRPLLAKLSEDGRAKLFSIIGRIITNGP